MTRLVFPRIPEALFKHLSNCQILPSTVTFVVGPGQVLSPQTGHHWYVEVDHDMKNPRFFSLIPQASPHHVLVESRRPRFTSFVFTDAWMTTNHHFFLLEDMEVHVSRSFFNPEKADDKLYFDRAPFYRMEVLVPDRFIEGREILDALRRVVPPEFEIDSLAQRQ